MSDIEAQPAPQPLHDEALLAAILKSAAQLGGLLEMAPDRHERGLALTSLKLAVHMITKAMRPDAPCSTRPLVDAAGVRRDRRADGRRDRPHAA